MPRTSTSITLPDDLLERAMEFSKKDSRPLSYLVEKALREYLDAQEAPGDADGTLS